MYEYHPDRSGVMISSRLRPVINLEPGADGWGLTPDTVINAFLERTGLGHDVMTDEDLHARGRAATGPLPGGRHRVAPRVLVHRHVGRARGLSRRRWTADVPGRERVLLAGVVLPGPGRGDGGPPGRGRNPGVDRGTGRVLPPVGRRVRRAVAAAGPGAEPHLRGGVRRPGVRPGRARTGGPMPASTAGRRGSSTGSNRAMWWATTAWAKALLARR